jgi:hypothetical protein
VIKMIPALSAVVFVLLFRTPTLFTILLAAALVFCMFGDVGSSSLEHQLCSQSYWQLHWCSVCLGMLGWRLTSFRA